VGVTNFLGQSIGIDKNNAMQYKFYSSIKTVGATVLGGMWALEWAMHTDETNFRCSEFLESACLIPKLQLNSFRDHRVHTDRGLDFTQRVNGQ